MESVSRLATVLDLDRPPKLESTDYKHSKTRVVFYVVPSKQQRSTVKYVFYLAFSADLTALGTAAAVALFHFPEHCSP